MNEDFVSVVFVGGGTLDGTTFALPRTQTEDEVPADEGEVIVRYRYVRADQVDSGEAAYDSEGRARFKFVGQSRSQ